MNITYFLTSLVIKLYDLKIINKNYCTLIELGTVIFYYILI